MKKIKKAKLLVVKKCKGIEIISQNTKVLILQKVKGNLDEPLRSQVCRGLKYHMLSQQRPYQHHLQ